MRLQALGRTLLPLGEPCVSGAGASVSPLPHRTSTSSASRRRWNTWAALTIMQHKPWALPDARPCAMRPEVTQAPQGTRRPGVAGPSRCLPNSAQTRFQGGGWGRERRGCGCCSPLPAALPRAPCLPGGDFSFFLSF